MGSGKQRLIERQVMEPKALSQRRPVPTGRRWCGGLELRAKSKEEAVVSVAGGALPVASVHLTLGGC